MSFLNYVLSLLWIKSQTTLNAVLFAIMFNYHFILLVACRKVFPDQFLIYFSLLCNTCSPCLLYVEFMSLYKYVIQGLKNIITSDKVWLMFPVNWGHWLWSNKPHIFNLGHSNEATFGHSYHKLRFIVNCVLACQTSFRLYQTHGNGTEKLWWHFHHKICLIWLIYKGQMSF